MNGKTEADIISNEDHHIKYNEKKRMSLTLPLVNVVSTTIVCEQPDNNEAAPIDNNTIDVEQSTDVADESNKKKKIYESDDTFIQTIFSQTIKSTTATPTEDEPSHSFDAFIKTTSTLPATIATSNSENENDENDENVIIINDRSENIVIPPITTESTESTESPEAQQNIDEKQEPETAYTYFHKTIDEDDSPDLDCENEIKIYSPSSNNTLTTTTTVFSQSFDRTQANISIKFKENTNETTHQSFDNSLNDKSTASASNDANHDLEHSLTQSYSFDSDVSVLNINICNTCMCEMCEICKIACK